MSSIRREGAQGIRRGLRQSIGGGGAVADSIDALWADYGASAIYWFDASGLVGQTVTSRVGGYVLTEYDASDYACTLSLGSVGSCSTVVVLPTGTLGGSLYCDPGAADVARRRVIGARLLDAAEANYYDTVGADGVQFSAATAASFFGGTSSQGGTVATADAVLSDGHSGVGSSHFLRFSGAALVSGTRTNVVFPGGAGTFELFMPLEDPAQPVAFVLWAGFSHAALSDAQQLDIETRLMALMGI